MRLRAPHTHLPWTDNPNHQDHQVSLVTTLRRAAQERGGPLPSAGVADAPLDAAAS